MWHPSIIKISSYEKKILFFLSKIQLSRIVLWLIAWLVDVQPSLNLPWIVNMFHLFLSFVHLLVGHVDLIEELAVFSLCLASGNHQLFRRQCAIELPLNNLDDILRQLQGSLSIFTLLQDSNVAFHHIQRIHLRKVAWQLPGMVRVLHLHHHP